MKDYNDIQFRYHIGDGMISMLLTQDKLDPISAVVGFISNGKMMVSFPLESLAYTRLFEPVVVGLSLRRNWTMEDIEDLLIKLGYSKIEENT